MTRATDAPLDDLLRDALGSRHPLLYLHSPDEARVLAALERVVAERGVPLREWARTDAPGGADPASAVLEAAAAAEPGFVVHACHFNVLEEVPHRTLSSTNVVLPLVNWTPVATNTFGLGGEFSVTNPVTAGEPGRYYLLQIP